MNKVRRGFYYAMAALGTVLALGHLEALVTSDPNGNLSAGLIATGLAIFFYLQARHEAR